MFVHHTQTTLWPKGGRGVDCRHRRCCGGGVGTGWSCGGRVTELETKTTTAENEEIYKYSIFMVYVNRILLL